MKLKYIRDKHCGFVFFTGIVSHAEIAKKVCIDTDTLISAGFVQETEDEDGQIVFVPFGQSVTLDLGVHPEDADMLRRECSCYF